MAPPLILRIIGDNTGYLKTAEQTIGTNTKIGASFHQVGVNANLSADAQIRAAVKAQEALRLNAMAGSTRNAERELSKAIRGSLAGANVFGHLGRSLLLASSGFVAFEIGAEVIERSIAGAEDLEKAQRSLDVAIEHTRGNVAKLTPEYQATAKAAAQFGQSEAEALTGLARATVLTGNAAAAQRAYQEALVISKATGKDFNAVLTAAAKGQEGITTSLRRYGILLDSTASGQEQFTQVMKRFGGQAEANTTASERLDASIANFEATLGKALLPTFGRLSTRLSDWLTKTEKSGKLQKDVNRVVDDAGDVFHTLGSAVGLVDKVTGSFANTLKLILALKFASVIGGWVGNLVRLEDAWGGVTAAATTAAAAETAAAGGAGAAAAAGGAGVAARVAMYTGAGAGFAAKASRFGPLALGAGLAFAQSGDTLRPEQRKVVNGRAYYLIKGEWLAGERVRYGGVAIPSNFGQLPPFLGGPSSSTSTSTSTGPFGNARPEKQFTATFALKQQEQLLQAQAALTRSSTDDVAAARAVVARIKRLIDQGRLHGAALIQALGLEASAMSTIWQAEGAAAQKRAAAAEAARERIAAQIQNSIDPLRLEVALSRAQALGKPLAGILRKLRAAAKAALASGKLSLEQQKEAWDQITSVNQQLAELAKNHEKSAKAAAREFHLANTRELSAGLGLSDAERAVLRARLSQLGPGRHRPDRGVGAYGYEIGGNGRPIHHHTHVHVGEHEIGTAVTKFQERRHRRNSHQRRGPNAG